ncbi:hypothetical protein IEU95_02385 [Hoyosella rhizosphaerae]|uniref:Isoprenylcysteine carboxylmethyltransferase family protein n=1 Tax=Hoyosella rhizosphaerae TaxID=1755582 RepID=A0A916UDC4_9ACTN|nr:methyltransferase [Hoyosella rhizosphaerae]MBN4925663.1 hypothetical protein [Hoyosella rhizosphaerae]GGC68862.1 hypothetical protein GCM10011410_22100 [Hoyosella rhizosphaerae]
MTPDFDISLLRSATVLAPVLLAGALLLTGPTARVKAAAALATLWNAVGLILVNAVAVAVGWWTFGTTGAMWSGVPVDVVLGWAVLWGAVPVLLARWVPLFATAVVLVVADLLAMPYLSPLVVLSKDWLYGEVAACALCLGPGLLLGYLTYTRKLLTVRVALQAVVFTTLLIVILPSVAFALTDRSWSEALSRVGGPGDMILVQVLVIVGIAGLRAVAEFARAGGTPFPWDPPQRLVTHGPYAYVANPMQLSTVLILLLMAAILREPILIAVAIGVIAFSWSIARIDEHADLRKRFGTVWDEYRNTVRDWLPRWRPSPALPVGTVFIARQCHPCSELSEWVNQRSPVNLAVTAAEDHRELLIRMRYETQNRHSSGVRAFADVCNHLNLGWAVLGWILRVRPVGALVQLVVDAVGGGPRELRRAE